MSIVAAHRLHRLLLGGALVVKGLSWPAAPPAVAAVLVVAGLAAIAGTHTRVAFGTASALVWITIATDSYLSNHFFLLGLLTAYATLITDDDRWGIGELLTMVQVSTVYFWAAAWKLNPEFLSGAVVHVEWSQSWLAGPSTPAWAAAAASWLTIAAELTLAVGLWWRRAVVPWILGLGVAVHLGMILTIGSGWSTTGELIAFALMCGSSVPFFVSRPTRRRAPSRAPRRPRSRAATTAPATPPGSPT